MKVVDAHWEQRNLGVTCAEVLLEPGDHADSVHAVLAAISAEYVVVKIPVSRSDLMHCVQGLGFNFVEASLTVQHRLKLVSIQGLEKRVDEATTYARVDRNGIEKVLAEVRRNMFTTDRVIRDPFFSAERAAERYINWIDDELRRGGCVYEVAFLERGIGFFTMRSDKERNCFSVLSGIYCGADAPGMGSALLRKVVEESIQRNGKRLLSSISTNNPAVLNTHMVQGFEFTDIHYVYTRHTHTVGVK